MIVGLDQMYTRETHRNGNRTRVAAYWNEYISYPCVCENFRNVHFQNRVRERRINHFFPFFQNGVFYLDAPSVSICKLVDE